MPGFPTPTNFVGVNANRRDPRKPGESPALQRKGTKPRAGPCVTTMLFKAQSAAAYGIDAYLVEVEVDVEVFRRMA